VGTLLCLPGLSRAAAESAACEIPLALSLSRPDPAGPPTSIRLSVLLADLPAIRDTEQLFEADFRVELSWRDPRLAADVLGHSLETCRPRLDEVWNPALRLLNQRQVSQLLPETLQIDADGGVQYAQRYTGLFTARFDLREFPLDRQTLSVEMISPRSAQQISIVPDVASSGRLAEVSIPDWTLHAGRLEVGEFEIAGRTPTRLRFLLPAERHWGYYVFRVLVPLILITLMSFSVFLIDPKDLGSQVTISSSSVLTLIMFNFSLQELLPRVSYLTRLDLFVQGSTLLVFAALAESISTAALTSGGRHELALRIDWHARWLFPLLLASLVIATRFV
jgi:hypothetical protein